MTNANINQTVTIRDLQVANKKEMEGGTIVRITHNGKRAYVACDSGIRVFFKSIRNDIFYESDSSLRFRLVF